MTVLAEPMAALMERVRGDGGGLLEVEHPAFASRAPGRLDVMGGIADYSGAVVCEWPLDVGAAAVVQRREDRRLVMQTCNPQDASAAARVEMSLDDLWGTAGLLPPATMQQVFAQGSATANRRWTAFVAGAYWVLAKNRKLSRRAQGANIGVYSSMPIGVGLGSSAALTVAVLAAMTGAYHLILDPIETAVVAQRVENQMAGLPRGVKASVTAMMGRAGKLLVLRCQPHTIERYLDLPAGLMVAAATMAPVSPHNPAPTYRDVRIGTFMAQAIITRMYKDLGVRGDPTGGYLANVNPDLYARYFRPVLPERIRGREFLAQYESYPDWMTAVDKDATYQVRAAAEHHVLEAQRTRSFADLLAAAATRSGDAREQTLHQAGTLMQASHESYRQIGMAGPHSDALTKRIVSIPGVHGARVSSGGGDDAAGTAVALLANDTPAVREELQRVASEHEKQTGRATRVVTGTSAGAVETGAVKV